VTKLLADTLEKSPNVDADDVSAELRSMQGLGSALIAGGHLEKSPLVVMDGDLRLEIRIATGDSALEIEENLNPIPGGGSATAAWAMHVPAPVPLAAAVREAVRGCAHVTSEPAPAESSSSATSTAPRIGAPVLNLAAIERLRNQT
jgi:hypothetical protein